MAVLENFRFYGAPVAVILCMSDELDGTEALSVGIYLQNFLLGLTQAGVGSCVEISIAEYEGVVRREVGIEDGLRVLVGVAVGFEDGGARVNRVRSPRDRVDESTVWVGE